MSREIIWSRSCAEDECTVAGVDGKLQGSIPSWLQGSLYRVGSGIRKFGEDEYLHSFDGQAVLHVFHVDGGKVQYRSRALDSRALRTNKAANRIAISEFGTMATPDPCQTILGRLMARFVPGIPDLDATTDNCGVTVFFLGDEVYAATETTTIHRIDPVSLATLDGDGTKYHEHVMVLNASAHVHTEPDGTTLNLGNSRRNGSTFYNVLRMPKAKKDEEGKTVSSIEQTEIIASVRARSKWHLSYYHSFGVTQNYVVFLETPMTLNVFRVLSSKLMGYSYEDCLDYDPHGQGRFTLIEKATGKIHPVTYTTDAFACFHHINAYEENDEVVVDLCASDGNVYRALYLEALRNGEGSHMKAKPVRFVLPLKMDDSSDKNLVKKSDSKCQAHSIHDQEVHVKEEALSELNCEMPRINYDRNGQKYKFFYAVGMAGCFGHFLSLLKTNADTKQVVGTFKEEGVQVSEPIFVARPGAIEEDDGCVLSLIFKDNQPNYAGLLILDGKSFEEIARVDFEAKGPVTQTLHGMFATQGLLRTD